MTPEGKVKRAVVQWLRAKGYLVVRVNSGRIKLGKPGDERMVCLAEPGTADLICCSPDGQFVAVEVKRPGGEPTDLQLGWGREVEERIGVWVCVDSVDALEDQLG